MRYLYDANLLLALTHENHQDHDRSHRWLNGHAIKSWATCEITRSALVRLSANPHVVKHPCNPVTTFNNLEVAMRRSDHQFLTLPDEGFPVLRRCLAKCQGYRQITDAYLIATAIANGVKLATLDAKIRHLSPDPEAIEFVPVL